MNKNQLQNEILAIIRTVYDDKNALQRIHDFLLAEIYEEPKTEKIPSKYKKVVSEIADGLSTGLICFFNPDNMEFADIPKDLAYDPEEFEMMTGETFESAAMRRVYQDRVGQAMHIHFVVHSKCDRYFDIVYDTKKVAWAIVVEIEDSLLFTD